LRNVVFLLGSGTSLPAGLPGVTELTDQVLSARFATRYAGTFYVGNGTPANSWDGVEEDDSIVQLVRDVAARVETFW
jgi:hypothetical protein